MTKSLAIVLAVIIIGLGIYFIVSHDTAGQGASAGSVNTELFYNNASADLITVATPKAGETVPQSFVVSGEARGTWYFEASFPVELQDKDGTVLWQGPAEAEGDWMKEDFVPFSVTVTLPAPYEGAATLILHKDNPSGLLEHEASVSLPIVVGTP